ncbi:N-acetylmuramoyl-L-alanine amidase [Candidatus Gracilibacteria bacterium]|nr:N-acetylmuramoyl-L-alanine amidase [Candidatus Gracilibacteria bacterium]
MATISPDTLTAELRLREKSQNYGGIDDAIVKATNETNAARNAVGGNALGEIKAGLESMIGVSNNLVENAESTAKTVIAKVKPSGHGIEANLKPLLTDAEIASHQAVLKNAAVDISAIFGPAITSLTAASKMNHKIFTDFSPEAATTALKKAGGLLSNLPLKDMQKNLVPEKFKDIVETAVNKIEIKEIQKDIDNTLAAVKTELKKTTDGVDSGNLLKDISEDVSRNLSTTIGSFGDEFTRLKSLPIINDLLGGFNALGLDKAISTLKIDPSILTKAGSLGIGTNIGSLVDMKGFLKQMDKLAPDLASLTTALKIKTDTAITTLDKTKTSIASAVTENNTSPHETADVTDTTKQDRFKTIGSIEEIVSVLKSSRRPLTTIVWHWTGHYTDDRNIGAFQIDQEYLAESKRIPFHFVIAKNGDIQTGFPISSGSAHVASQFNALSFGVAFVGGYNGARGDRPLVKLSSNSYTVAQWKSFYAFMKAFYIAIPGGDAFGQNELSENAPGEGPGFTVNSIIKLHPFNRKNTCEPISDGKFLTREEIIAKLI